MISDNKDHIIYSSEDIQRYWNGQLSQQEMHAMEKAALDDPFLADAMEGMGEALREHDVQVVNAELKNTYQQLEARVVATDRPARVITFGWWKVAAVAVIVIVAGLWIYTSQENKSLAPQLSKVQENEDKDKAEVIVGHDSAGGPLAATPDSASVVSAPAESATLSRSGETYRPEPGLQNFNTEKPAAKHFSDTISNALAQRANGLAIRRREESEKKEDTFLALQTPLPAISDSVRPTTTEVIKLSDEQLAKQQERQLNQDVKLQNVVKGVVTDNKNNPLANAYIMLNNRNATITDGSGNFKFSAPDSVVNVSVGLAGYATQNFRLRSDYSGAGMTLNNNIQLQPDNAQLNEVVVIGYGTEKYDKKSSNTRSKSNPVKDREAAYLNLQAAEPIYGWLSFDQYIEKNKRVPADNPNLVGEVVVSFEVGRRGELSDFKIEKSLSPQHDAEAQRLIREGPAWKLRVARKSRVTVIVRF